MNARRPLSFHAVSFGEESSLSSLRRMTEIALDIQKHGARDPLHPSGTHVLSSYTEALDTVSWLKSLFISWRLILCYNQVSLSEAFLGIAESLGKPRGFLLSSR